MINKVDNRIVRCSQENTECRWRFMTGVTFPLCSATKRSPRIPFSPWMLWCNNKFGRAQPLHNGNWWPNEKKISPRTQKNFVILCRSTWRSSNSIKFAFGISVPFSIFPLPADNCNQLGEKFLSWLFFFFFWWKYFQEKFKWAVGLGSEWLATTSGTAFAARARCKLLFINFSPLAASRGAAACNSQTHKTQLGVSHQNKANKMLAALALAPLSPCTDLNDFLV